MSTLDSQEVEKFSKIADEWWDPNGKFKPLHQFNPERISYIKEKITAHFRINNRIEKPLKNIKILDVGCGGGLVCEPLAKLGSEITGIDASEKNIEVAKIHSRKTKTNISYKKSLIEDLDKNNKFNVVLALEIIEHVLNPQEFIDNCCNLVDEDGILIISTINKTIKSLLTAKIAAEYILKWLPIGTHDWSKFLKPSQINEFISLSKNSLIIDDLVGFKFNIIKRNWEIDKKDIDVNYIISFTRKRDNIDLNIFNK